MCTNLFCCVLVLSFSSSLLLSPSFPSFLPFPPLCLLSFLSSLSPFSHSLLSPSFPYFLPPSLLSSPYTITGRKRYLVLRLGCLYYFANETAKEPKGCFTLAGYQYVYIHNYIHNVYSVFYMYFTDNDRVTV